MTNRPARRRPGWLVVTGVTALVALALTAVLAVTLWASAPGRQLRQEATQRSPHEVVRYLLRRLQGHPRLEAVLVPPLHALQRRIEREPPPGPLPDLGKGQRPHAFPPPPGLVRTWHVDTPQAIRDALLQASAGTQIVVAPGLYPFDTKLRLGQDGRADAPIALRAERPGTVWFEFGQVEGVLVDRPHWLFENLDIRGTCPRHDDCEHAFHVVARAHHVTIRNNRLRDFNAHLKVNGWGGDWPDHGQLLHNTLTNTAPRQTHLPVVMFDLVGASHWRVADNWVSHFVKASGNQVAYGLFMKGASEGGRFERNLVVCTPRGISQPGVRVGISFGGGRTDPTMCRTGNCSEFEHRHGLAANNIVAHCNDVGLDVNGGRDIALVHNTVVNTAGIGARHQADGLRLRGNWVEGGIWLRDGIETQAPNAPEHTTAFDTAADTLERNALTHPATATPANAPFAPFGSFDSGQPAQRTRPGALEPSP